MFPGSKYEPYRWIAHLSYENSIKKILRKLNCFGLRNTALHHIQKVIRTLCSRSIQTSSSSADNGGTADDDNNNNTVILLSCRAPDLRVVMRCGHKPYGFCACVLARALSCILNTETRLE